MTAVTVFATIAGATIAWAVAEYWRLSGGRPAAARVVWTIGAMLMLVHSAAAFCVFYRGSHLVALAETARQTKAMTGLDVAAGLYLNYLFVTAWVVDSLWWWVAPASYEARPAAVSTGLRALFFFMFLNGAVIFADGWMRLVGVVSVASVAASWYGSKRIWRSDDLAS